MTSEPHYSCCNAAQWDSVSLFRQSGLAEAFNEHVYNWRWIVASCV
jgi:hypothetical protein